ncbi:MAG TPA: HD domain-containing protein [Verrucomicrobiae bacterium]|nr:HD domain-containing protein [Verrucomicrobiae bacterium]
MNITEARSEAAALMRARETEPEHVLHVASLAMQLFDGLAPLHQLGPEDRLLLEAAGYLHDIGWSVSERDGAGHHKASARLIREHNWKALDACEVNLVALVARYHRKSLPEPGHLDFTALPAEDQRRVELLAAMLRIADGLDRTHRQWVQEVHCQIGAHQLELRLVACAPVGAEISAAGKKADLARRAFAREVFVTIGREAFAAKLPE